jgi:hypothetical protein
MRQQEKSFLQIANLIYENMSRNIGTSIEGERSEKFQLYISYDIKKAEWVDRPVTEGYGYWNIPRYTNGSTRRAECLFLLPCTAVGDAAYPYLVKDNSEMEKKFTEGYNRERILAWEYFGEDKVEIIWSFDFGKPHPYGQHHYWVDKFWFGLRINGEIVCKNNNILKFKIWEQIKKKNTGTVSLAQ